MLTLAALLSLDLKINISLLELHLYIRPNEVLRAVDRLVFAVKCNLLLLLLITI